MAFRVLAPAIKTAASVAIALALPAVLHAAGDPERGRQLAYTCYGCHGIESYKNAYPTYSVPKLEGQHAEYLTLALQAYSSGERSHSTMYSQAASMNEQDMLDLAAFLAATPLKPGATPVGELPAKASELCVACHGPDGVGITPLYATLAGQHADYLEQALRDYRDGSRRNPVMAGFAAGLTDADIKALAAYYAAQRPALTTAKHAMWFAQEEKSGSK